MLFTKLGKGGYLFNQDSNITPCRKKDWSVWEGGDFALISVLRHTGWKDMTFKQRVSFFYRKVSGTGTKENSFLRFLSLSREWYEQNSWLYRQRTLTERLQKLLLPWGHSFAFSGFRKAIARLWVSPRSMVGGGVPGAGRVGNEVWLCRLLSLGPFAVACCFVAQLHLTLCDPVDCSPPGPSVHGILQARILEWVAISFSRGSSWPRDRTQISGVSCTGRRILYH